MMKTEPPSATGGNGTSGGSSGGSGSSNLRSPSPHRNAYEAGLAALKKATDHLNNAANGASGPPSKPAPLPRPTGRGRKYGSNVHRIKNMFMQMQSPGDEEDGAKMIGKEQAVKLSLPRASSLNENVDHSALLKLGATVSERVNRFDSKPSAEGGGSSVGFSKLQETRRIFEQRTLQEKQAATNRILLKKERASGFQDSRLDVVARFNGSTEALDRLDDPPVSAPTPATIPAVAASVGPGDAVSPTVSQLSAAFEKGELQNNLYLPQRRSGPALAPKPKPPARAEPTGKAKVLPTDKEDCKEVPAGAVSTQAAELAEATDRSIEGVMASEEKEGFGQSGDQLSNSSYSSSSSVAVTSSSSSSSSEVKPELEAQATATEARGSSTVAASEREPQVDEQDCSTGGSEAGARLVQAEVHASLENGEKQPSSSSPSPEDKGADSERRRSKEEEEEENDEDGSRKDDYSEGDLVDISAYSGLGEEDSGGSQLDDEEDEEDEEVYQPETSCSEIPGLPEEEEPPPSNRKIRFSTGPIKVFTTYSNEDYDRRNDDVDPMAASAEYELEKRVEKLDLFPVELEKDSDGLGISIIGMGAGADMGLEKLGIFVKTVTEGGAAQRDGRIQVNDLIVEVDGTSLVGVTQSLAASVLRNTTGTVRFVIGREKPGEQSEVAQLIQQTLEQERWQREMMEQRYKQYMEEDEETGEYATDEEEEMSPVFPNSIEVFDLAENQDMSPVELDPEKLAHKFKELQIKHAVTQAEIQLLKRKLAHAEQDKLRWRMERAQLEQNIRDSKERMEKLEGYWMEAQSLCKAVDEHLKETQAQYQTLERKYSKAKRLIKEYQQKEIEYLKKETAQRRAQEESDATHKEEADNLQEKITDLETKVDALKTPKPS